MKDVIHRFDKFVSDNDLYDKLDEFLKTQEPISGTPQPERSPLIIVKESV